MLWLVTRLCLTLCDPSRPLCPWDSPGKNTWVGCHALLQGIFPTRGSNPGLSYCRWFLYHLSHQGNPWILEWVSSSLLQGIFLTQELNWGPLNCKWILNQLNYHESPKLHIHTYNWLNLLFFWSNSTQFSKRKQLDFSLVCCFLLYNAPYR